MDDTAGSETADAAFDTSARAFLRRTTRFYERLVAHVQLVAAQDDDETTLRWVALAAEVAWMAHPGRLADARLEEIALAIGRRLDTSADDDAGGTMGHDTPGVRRLLHVATTVYGTGGHTRLLENWVKTDDGSIHALMLLDQGTEPVRAALADRIAASGGGIDVLPPGTSRLDRARRLRAAARAGYAAVVLHVHPHDVVPLVAFATEGGPPVAVLNHADHVFWLGASVADLVVEYRDFGAELSRERRDTRDGYMLPLPLDVGVSMPTRAEARARLGIAEDEVVLLTMGSPAKYVPTRVHRFFDTATRLLDRHPDARLYVVGVGPGDVGVLGIAAHDRLDLLGVVPDPGVYEAAADLYLEGYPFGSYTALLQTAARGVCPVVMHAPTAHNDSAREIALRGLVVGAADETAYLAAASALIDAPETRRALGRAVAERIRIEHGADASRRHLGRIYEKLPTLVHRVASLRVEAPLEARHDLDLARFQSARMAIPVAEWVSTATVIGLSTGELLRYLALSIGAGDTRWSPRHAKAWLSVAKRRLLAWRAAAA